MSEKSKNLYHSALVKMGQVWIQVDGEPTPSQFRGKPDYVYVTINNERFAYSCENERCKQFFVGRRGQKLFVEASGRQDDAEIRFLGQPGSQVQQPPPMPPPQNQPQQSHPASYVPPPSPPAPMPQQSGDMTPPQALAKAREMMHRRLSLFKIAVRATLEFKREFDKLPDDMKQGIKFEGDVFWARATSFNIGLEDMWRLGFPDHMPKNIDLATLQMVAKQTQSAPQQPPPPQPCQKCGTLHGPNECPEDD